MAHNHIQTDHMAYEPTMESIESNILDQVLNLSALHGLNCEMPDQTPNLSILYGSNSKSTDQVRTALAKDRRDMQDFAALLSPAAAPLLEEMAAAAKIETARQFGGNVSLFTPLYLANYCVNHCTYCGFGRDNPIRRGKLTFDEIRRELTAIAATGLDEILLLTGESREISDLAYIGEAVKLAAEMFSTVGLEIYPLNTDEYAYLHTCGADFVNVYQETYCPETYARVHPDGPKRSFPYRFHAQERAIRGGMRGISFGALLGLGDFRRDAFAAGLHAYFLQQKYPHAEIAFSVPRFRSFLGQSETDLSPVGERQLLQVMLAYRLFLPFAGITISTRERAGFRDHVIGLCATKISAGVLVGVGGHDLEPKGDEQFEIADPRSVAEIHEMIQDRGLQPVYTDYIRGD